MARVDLVVRGGRVVDPDGVTPLDLVVQNGRIEARMPPGTPVEASETVDAAGLLLLPGLVDAHVHCREPGLTHKEDFSSATRAAAVGGVTTILVMPTDEPWTATPAQFEAKRALAEGRVFCDVGLQAVVGRDLAGLADLVELGAVSFEIFTADVPPDFLFDTAARLGAALDAVRRVGGRAAVSPGDQSILLRETARLAPGRSTPNDFVRTRPPHAEAQGIASAILAAAGTDCPLHIRQSGSRLGIETFRRLRTLARVTIETSPQLLFFTSADYARFGPAVKASPPLRDPADRGALRAALADGTLDIVATDHAPHADADKAAAADFAVVPGGFSGVQTLLPALVSLVDEGLIDWPALVRVAAARPADVFGISGRKGRLAPGRDADILLVDPGQASVVRGADQLSRSRFTPFDGLRVSASLRQVFLRGRPVFDRGHVGSPARGIVINPRR